MTSASLTPIRASVFGDRGVFLWQKALHVAADLPEPVRYSLVVLGLYMDPDGTSGRPGYERFALARGKSDRTLRTHIEQAIAAGWLECTRRGGRSGDGTVRASVWVATFPPQVFTRLNDVLMPAWGDCGPSHPEVLGFPDERPADTPSQQEVPELPVEDVSTGNLDPSTGSPALPPTDHFHRPDAPISQSVQRAEANALLYRLYGLADDQAGLIIEEAHRRAAEPIRSLVRYLEEMADRGDLTTLVEAIQRVGRSASVADEAESEGFPVLEVPARSLLCAVHPGGPEDPHPIDGSRCLLCNGRRRRADRAASDAADRTGLRARLEHIKQKKRDELQSDRPRAGSEGL